MSDREQITETLARAAYTKGRTTGPEWETLDNAWLRDHYRAMGEYYADALTEAGHLPESIGFLLLAKQGKNLRIVRDLTDAAGAEQIQAECQEHAAANPEWYGKFEYLTASVSLCAAAPSAAAEGGTHPEGSGELQRTAVETEGASQSDGGEQQ
ncbi:hypothetical protein LTT66_17990 [Nocardia gipuzkoensis]|uniref:hypothetical protein n=1 Tax=Nocardia gipuzkoensis TaxID=2749991 RepID=UPI001E4EC15A|nr:hypothetical protein [Nocardia gipuzkoensis]UGT71863.1 hypothetical protein LTT66_17990 [Nocardia gipuzkoensis]